MRNFGSVIRILFQAILGGSQIVSHKSIKYLEKSASNMAIWGCNML